MTISGDKPEPALLPGCSPEDFARWGTRGAVEEVGSVAPPSIALDHSTERAKTARNTPTQDSQHVLKAEAARPDATDRENPAYASPDGGPMGVGQSAAADPPCEALGLEALRWAKCIRNTLPLYFKDCNVLDDLEDFLRRVGALSAPSASSEGGASSASGEGS